MCDERSCDGEGAVDRINGRMCRQSIDRSDLCEIRLRVCICCLEVTPLDITRRLLYSLGTPSSSGFRVVRLLRICLRALGVKKNVSSAHMTGGDQVRFGTEVRACRVQRPCTLTR